MAKVKSLGRGLDALFSDNSVEESEGGVTTLRLYDIEPNRDQPRKTFDEAALSELADSIREHGVIQPLVVRRKANGMYEIVAGERRWRASKLAGLTEVPVIVKELDDVTAAELSLIENLQREDLNAVDEANGYKALMDTYGMTQEQISKRVGKSRAVIANTVRILALDERILDMVVDGKLSYAHARTILGLIGVYDAAKMREFAEYVCEKGLSVRETERIVRSIINAKPAKEKTPVEKSYYEALERRLSDSIGRKVRLSQNSMTIGYTSSDDLEELIKSLCGNGFFSGD